jgi:DNA-binding NtrC family response regulator
MRAWRDHALTLAHEGKWREATALQRALVSCHDGRAPRMEMQDRYRLLRLQLALGSWREALEEVDALYPRLSRRDGGSGPAAGWLFLARGIAQFQVGWGSRARRSFSVVLRVARRTSPCLLESALEVVAAIETQRGAPPERSAFLARALVRARGGRARPGSAPPARDEIDELLREPSAFTLLRQPLPHDGFCWSRLTELLLGPRRLREWLSSPPAGETTLLDSWLSLSEHDPTGTVPAWLAPRLAREAEELACRAEPHRRARVLEAVANLAARFTEPWARAELLSAVSSLALWCIDSADGPRSARGLARARADLGLAAGLFRQLALERRAQECEERWLELGRQDESAFRVMAPAAEAAWTSSSSTARRGKLSLESVRRRCEAAGFVTADPRVLRDMARLMLLASSPLPVLVLGESGTGKEVVARALHRWSGRPGECVAIHCGAIPRDLLESELFGHSRGAFTGALGEKPGLVEVSDGGTLFLDEIGEMGTEAQMKVLRVLESGEVRRVGDLRARRVMIRLVAATHCDLDTAVREGRFRLDLLHRIRGVTVMLPPLRERRADIPRLVERFLFEVRAHGAVHVSDAVLAKLLCYPWPGNVRELRATVLRAAYFAQAVGVTQIGPEMVDFPDEESPCDFVDPGPIGRAEVDAVSADDVANAGLDTVLERLERRLIVQALEENGWNRTRTAERLGGLSRTTLLSKMKRLGIEGAPAQGERGLAGVPDAR